MADPSSTRPSRKVLIVDDSATTREAVRLILEDEGFDVIAPDSVFGVTTLVMSERPDLILMDVNMPALEGNRIVELLRSRRWGQDAVVLLHSSLPEAELQQLTEDCGADGYLKKTLDPELLPRQVRDWLNKRTQQG